MNRGAKFFGEIGGVLYRLIRVGKEIDRAENFLDRKHGLASGKL
jgi:hypothetical protein